VGAERQDDRVTRQYKGSYRVYMVSATGKHKVRIHEAGATRRPSWTSNGKSVYMPHGTIDRVNAHTGRLEKHRQFTLDIPQTATLSPNAKKVAF
jgi:hypothetical protein